jgi:hypothetical protein
MTQCLNNLQQIGLGVAMYVHDSQDRFPPPWRVIRMGIAGAPFLPSGVKTGITIIRWICPRL